MAPVPAFKLNFIFSLPAAIATNLYKSKFSRLYCAGLCFFSIWLLIVLLGVSSLIVLAAYPSSHSEHSLAFQGDTIHLASANGFWYRDYKVVEHVEQSDGNRKLQFYTLPCGDIQTHSFQGHFQSRELYLTYKTRSLGIVDYLYLLPGSNVSYNICLWTNQSLTTSAEFFVFDSLLAYQEYISDVTKGRDTSVMQQDLRIGSPEHPACSRITFIASKSAYYFMSAECPGGITYRYNITSNVVYLNSTDYEQFLVCSVTESEPCELVIDRNFFGSWKDICLLAYAIPSPPYDVDPPTTHIYVETLKRYQVLIFPATLIVIGILGILGMLLVYLWMPTKRKGYALIN